MSGHGKKKAKKQSSDQLKRLGCILRLVSLHFTMDEGNNRAVHTMFKKLYDAGLIYRETTWSTGILSLRQPGR